MKKMFLTCVLLIISIIYATNDVFVLCEGNFGSNTASLWKWNGTKVQGPINWNPNSNPLGDVGQSLAYDEGKLFIVLNNSHSVEVLDTKSNKKITSIKLDNLSPRDIALHEKIAYVSGYNSYGIICFDTETYDILDTIEVGYLTEDILINDSKLYTAINMNSMWDTENQVFCYDISIENPTLIDSFEVVPGPVKLILHNNEIFISSTYYDSNWQTYAGMSKINLESGEVLMNDYGVNFNYSSDLAIIKNSVYRAYKNGMMKIDSDLTFDENNRLGQVDGTVYSMAVNDEKVYVGFSDFEAPDTVSILDNDGNILDNVQVGALPGDFAFVPAPSASNHKQQIVENFDLLQNYPNPFNPTTNIKFNMPKDGFVKLSVYNIRGEHVIDLVNSHQKIGSKSVSWDSIDKNGLQVPTGLYIYQLQTNNLMLSKKMMLLK